LRRNIGSRPPQRKPPPRGADPRPAPGSVAGHAAGTRYTGAGRG